MNKLITELQRLYFLHDQRWHSGDSGACNPADSSPENIPVPELLAKCLEDGARVVLHLLDPEGMVRALVIGVPRPADWVQVAKLCEGVQEDLDLPAPAVSVSGKAGYQLWFSLVEAVSVREATVFLDGLRSRYLDAIPPAHLKFYPALVEPLSPESGLIELPPAFHRESRKWSAFIDPAMGSMFMDEAGLEMAPNLDKQGDLLAQFESIKVEDFRRVLAVLETQAEPTSVPSGEGVETGMSPRQTLNRLSVSGHFGDPKSFLLAVMNDPSASAGQRIRAAKALLPYFEGRPGK